jgi:DNA-directed DNA polymerase III PolC
MNLSPHTHPESSLTGSTVKALIDKAKNLGRTHFVHTDDGHLSSALKVYKLTKKAKMSPILGIEIYFKDQNCPIIKRTSADRCRYFTLSLYAEDQTAYQALCKIVSRIDLPSIELYEESRQLWGWIELEEISKYNIRAVLGGIHCIVGKTMLSGHPDLGSKIFDKLYGMFGHRLAVALLCEPWSKQWQSVIRIKYKDGSVDTALGSDRVTTDKARRIRALDLISNSRHTEIKSRYSGYTCYTVNKLIESVELHKGFLPLPGGDASLRINKFLKALANRANVDVLATDYAYYADPQDKIVQTMKLETNKLHPNLYMKTTEEMINYLANTMKLSSENISQILSNNEKWGHYFDNFSLQYEWRLAESSDQSIQKMMDLIKKNGRMKWDDPIWTSRLKEEIGVIVKNPVKNLLPYFFPIIDILDYYKENGLLVGPSRGSAGGSLLSYLLGITNINPIKYNLSFSRFFSLTRITNNQLPDIDTDLESRDLLVGADGKSGYLYTRWGNKAAQISTRTTMRLKSSIKDVHRYLKGKVEPEIEIFTKGLPPPPQGVSDNDFVFGFENNEGEHIPGLIEQSEDLQRYATQYPYEWEIVQRSLGLPKAYSKHASAFVIADRPIEDMVPTKDGHITQYEAKEVEAAGLIKYDLLVVKQLCDIRVCIELINSKNKEKHEVGYFRHNGELVYIWDLPEHHGVFKSIWSGDTETCFQINTKAMIPFVQAIRPTSIDDLSTILALVRPGPLDFIDPNTGRNMAEEYVARKNGNGETDLAILSKLIPETYSVLVYQEQITKIAKELGGFDDNEAEKLRENAAKKKKVELMKQKTPFIKGAINHISAEEAEALWQRMETFARYSFNRSHSVGYSMITYACMFLKYYYPLEWWAAILTNASEEEITSKFWPYVKDTVMPPDINLSGDTMAVDYKNRKIRSKLGIIRGLGDATIAPIISNRPYSDIEDFVNKDVAGKSLSHKLIHVGVLDSLFPENMGLLEKLKLYEDAVQRRKYRLKSEEYKNKGKVLKSLGPKQGEIPAEYVNLTPMQDAAMKKSTLSSIYIDFFELGSKYSKALAPFAGNPLVVNPRGHETKLVTGQQLRRIEEIDPESVTKNIYIACTGFVVKSEEFSYAGGSKRALKLILDADNYISEKILWPDYETGQLIYPAELKKGCIVTVFFKKRAGKKDLIITSITIEE